MGSAYEGEREALLEAQAITENEFVRYDEGNVTNHPIVQAIQGAISRLNVVPSLQEVAKQLQRIRDDGHDPKAAWKKIGATRIVLSSALMGYPERNRHNDPPPNRENSSIIQDPSGGPTPTNGEPARVTSPRTAVGGIAASGIEDRPFWAILWPESLGGRIAALVIYASVAVLAAYALARAKAMGELHGGKSR